jgi:hypothetical protein
MDGRVHTLKKNKEALVVTSTEDRLEINSNKSKYMVISRGQNVGQCHNIKTDNISFERVEQPNIWEQA